MFKIIIFTEKIWCERAFRKIPQVSVSFTQLFQLYNFTYTHNIIYIVLNITILLCCLMKPEAVLSVTRSIP